VLLCTAAGSEAVVIERAGPTVMLRDFVAVCAVGLVESVALTVNEEVPAAVGVPLSAPSDASDRPVGSEPVVMLQVYGLVPPVAPRVAVYGVVARALGRDVVVTLNAAPMVMLSALLVVWLAGTSESVTVTVKL